MPTQQKPQPWKPLIAHADAWAQQFVARHAFTDSETAYRAGRAALQRMAAQQGYPLTDLALESYAGEVILAYHRRRLVLDAEQAATAERTEARYRFADYVDSMRVG